jgi:hypothetical protein
MKRTLALATLTMTLASCGTSQSGEGVSDALRGPIVQLANAVATNGAPAPVIAAARNVVSTFDAVQ